MPVEILPQITEGIKEKDEVDLYFMWGRPQLTVKQEVLSSVEVERSAYVD